MNRVLILMMAVVPIVTCSDDDVPVIDCRDGLFTAISDADYCVWEEPIIENGFFCPPDVAIRHERDGYSVCCGNVVIPPVAVLELDRRFKDNDSRVAVLDPIPIDILFVIDDSNSMCEEQQALIDSFASVSERLSAVPADFHVAVTTTDMEPFSDGPGQFETGPGMGSYECSEVGSLSCPAFTNPVLRVVDYLDYGVWGLMWPSFDDAWFEADFTCLASVGVGGSGFEKGLDALEAALSPELLATTNAGFRRDDSWLAVIFLSDENDCSDGNTLELTSAYDCEWLRDDLTPVSYYSEWFETLAQTGDRLQAIAIAVAGPDDGARPEAGETFDPSCNSEYGDAYSGYRYHEFAESFDDRGLVLDICRELGAGIDEQIYDHLRTQVTTVCLGSDPGSASIGVDVYDESLSTWVNITASVHAEVRNASTCPSGYGISITEGDPPPLDSRIRYRVHPLTEEELAGCVDADGDGYLAGADCDERYVQIDCNDDPSDGGFYTNPGRDEECDDRDHNCDGDTTAGVLTRMCPLTLGVCSGSTQRCVDEQWEDCEEAGRYSLNYENVSAEDESCDGLDNNCDGTADLHCHCIPGEGGPTQCGVDLGICQRGIHFCDMDGQFSDCVQADLETTIIYDAERECYLPQTECDTDEDCGAGEYCIAEMIDFREDFEDCCRIGTDAECTRQVCRSLTGETPCADTTECDDDEVCLADFCQPLVGINEAEICDGADNDCNGRIDDGSADCSPCPYGMVQVLGVAEPEGICMDAYEASRPDASSTDAGTFEYYASNAPGVMPWTGLDSDDADEACRGTAINDILPGAVTERRLCIGEELEAACGQLYPYGNSFDAGSCNDVSTGEGVQPTGSFPECCAEHPDSAEICDLSGNVAELVSTPFLGHFGGSAADDDAAILSCHEDGIVPISESALDPGFVGFRCCVVPTTD